MICSGKLSEQERQHKNEKAWENLGGYVTTSGCPCWDHTANVCIPKAYGFGYSINFWALFCCHLCNKTTPSTYRPTKRTWVFYTLIGVGILVFVTGVLLSVLIGEHCSGFHDNGQYYQFECLNLAENSTRKLCCVNECTSSELSNKCRTLEQLGGDAVVALGICLGVLGLLMSIGALMALIQNNRHLKETQQSLLKNIKTVSYVTETSTLSE